MSTQDAPSVAVTDDPEVDRLNSTDPFALLTCLMLDQQTGMELAFLGAWKVLNRFGTLDPSAIAAADPAEFTRRWREPPAIQRFAGAVSGRLPQRAGFVHATYDGSAPPAR